MGMAFKTLLDECVVLASNNGNPCPIEKKLVLSLACGFQDGKWLHRTLNEFVWDNIAETALSARERNALANRSHSALVAAARNLRLVEGTDDIGTGSELAEAVLYGVMRHHFDAIPAVPKIFHKQNVQDNAKGADSVHITICDGDFLLWIGEAKFYSSIESKRLASIVNSVGESLRSDKLSKETALICNLNELQDCIDDSDLVARIKAALSPDVSLDEIKPRLHVPILLLHECSITAAAVEWSDNYEKDLIAHHRNRAVDYFERQLKSLGKKIFKYDQITFHVIVIPVPSKSEVVERFVKSVEFYKDEGS